MNIFINDANILIDLAELGLLDAFSKLPFKLYTTDFVYAELRDTQKSRVSILCAKGYLTVIEADEEDLQGMSELLKSSSGLSFEDCSVWFYSKKLSGTLLTGDGKLRKQARKQAIEVRGIIYVFDELVKHKLLTYSTAVEKIKQLYQLNNRLPKEEVDKRIEYWSKLSLRSN